MTCINFKLARPAGNLDEEPGNQQIQPPESPIRKAIRMYFKDAKRSSEGISARDWWAANPIVLGSIKEEIWVLRVLAEHDNKGKLGKWQLRMNSRLHPAFDGNVLIKDVVISKRAA